MDNEFVCWFVRVRKRREMACMGTLRACVSQRERDWSACIYVFLRENNLISESMKEREFCLCISLINVHWRNTRAWVCASHRERLVCVYELYWRTVSFVCVFLWSTSDMNDEEICVPCSFMDIGPPTNISFLFI